MTKRLQAADYQALAEIRRALRQFLSFSEAAAGKASLSPAQHQALLAILGMPGRRPVAIGALAEYLGIKPHSAVGLADRLAAAGLVRRVADPEDRRRVGLEVTAKARAKLAALSVVHRGELKRLSTVLGPLLKTLG